MREYCAGRFVVRVLFDEVAFEGSFENGLAQARGVGGFCVELLGRVICGGQRRVDPAENFDGFRGRREWDRQRADF